jgi:hypothetical protein
MISYCPLDEIDTAIRPVPPPPSPSLPQQQRKIPLPPPKKEAAGFLDGEDTECNYLVLFFILGVLILACSDSMSIRR